MMRVLVDTDVILDYLLPRAAFVNEAARLWEANAEGLFEGFISAITPVNVFYLARKAKGIDETKVVIGKLLKHWQVCPVNDQVLTAALSLDWSDFEDAVQHTSAIQQRVDVLVTRNLSDYRQASLTILSPTDFLTRLSPPAS